MNCEFGDKVSIGVNVSRCKLFRLSMPDCTASTSLGESAGEAKCSDVSMVTFFCDSCACSAKAATYLPFGFMLQTRVIHNGFIRYPSHVEAIE